MYLAVIESGGCVCGQEEHVGKLVAGLELHRAEIQHGRDEHDAVEIQPVAVLEITGETCGTCGSIAFSRQEFWREPASIACGVQSDEISNALDVFFEAVVLPGFLALHRSGIAGADWVNENQVGLVEQGIHVIGQAIWRGQECACIAHDHALGAEQTEMQPYR